MCVKANSQVNKEGRALVCIGFRATNGTHAGRMLDLSQQVLRWQVLHTLQTYRTLFNKCTAGAPPSV